MSYLPTICSRCSAVDLTAATQIAQGPLACAQCGEAARVIPSCLYGEKDRELFADLSQAVAEGSLGSLQAAQLLLRLEAALQDGTYEAFFEVMSSRLPGFTPLQLAYGGKPSAQRYALGMLRTILSALSMQRSSGTMLAVEDPGTSRKAQ